MGLCKDHKNMMNMGIAPGILWELFCRIMGIWGLDIMGISGYVI
jgi:hypothetical protein